MCLKLYGTLVNRKKDNPDYVSVDMFPHRYFPVHCSYTALLMPMPVAQKLYMWSRSVRYVWKEGIFVTGVLRQAVGVQIQDIKER